MEAPDLLGAADEDLGSATRGAAIAAARVGGGGVGGTSKDQRWRRYWGQRGRLLGFGRILYEFIFSRQDLGHPSQMDG